MGYWGKMYGVSSDEFIRGVIAGIEAFAVWQDGKQYVGVLKRPLEEELEEVEKELGVESRGK